MQRVDHSMIYVKIAGTLTPIAWLALGDPAKRYPNPAVGLAVAGAALYAIGLVVFLTQRPRLWPRVFSHHEVFHMLVVAGSSAHVALALRYLASA